MSDISNASQAHSPHLARLKKRQRNELIDTIDTLIKGGVDITQYELQLKDDGVWIFHKPADSLATLFEDGRGRYQGILIVPDGPETEIYGPGSKTGRVPGFAQSGNVCGRR